MGEVTVKEASPAHIEVRYTVSASVSVNMWLVWLPVLVLLVLWLDVVGKIWRYYRRCVLLRPVPGWPAHWLYGNLHQVSSAIILHPSYCLPITNQQIERTEEFYRRLRGDAQKNRWRVTRTWIGPFIAIVTINHPETLKAILKGYHLFYHHCYLRQLIMTSFSLVLQLQKIQLCILYSNPG